MAKPQQHQATNTIALFRQTPKPVCRTGFETVARQNLHCVTRRLSPSQGLARCGQTPLTQTLKNLGRCAGHVSQMALAATTAQPIAKPFIGGGRCQLAIEHRPRTQYTGRMQASIWL